MVSAEKRGSKIVDFRKKFVVEPGSKVRLSKVDAAYKGKDFTEEQAAAETQKDCQRISKQQYLLYSEKKHSLLIVLQALDAAGKDGTVNHVMAAMNPQGTAVTGFKGPTAEDLEHDFLWRIHPHAPAKGTVAIFNRSHYEDLLVVRVNKLAPKEVWSERYEMINDFEKLLYRPVFLIPVPCQRIYQRLAVDPRHPPQSPNAASLPCGFVRGRQGSP
jgi:polyphosphate kinase 2 (PPK2 family)